MISSSTRVAGPYAGTGLQTVFPFNFKVFQATDVLAVQTSAAGVNTTLTLTSQYTVALNINQDTTPGGTVTLLSAPAVGYQITLSSQVPALQSLNLANAGNFYPVAINNALDYLTILVQQLAQSSGNALRFPINITNVSAVLPNPQAGLGLGWDPTGTFITNIDFVGATAASAAAAAASATSAFNSASTSSLAATALNFANTQLAVGIVTFNNFDMGFVTDVPAATTIDLGTVP